MSEEDSRNTPDSPGDPAPTPGNADAAQQGREQFAAELKAALTLAATASTIAAPVTHSRLLEMIVATAAQVIAARSASLFLIEYETRELTFEVALGQKAEEVKKFKVPLGHGIAGLVALSGQPLAIAEAERDPRLAADIAQSIGYIPQSILCVPLFYNDQIIGVIELLDKLGEPTFSPADMEALGLFANQAAVAIEQSRVHQNMAALINEVLMSFTMSPDQRQRLQQQTDDFASYVEGDDVYRQALDLARLVQEVAWQGADELKVCRAILESFAEYLRTRASTMGGQQSYYSSF